LRGVSSCTHAVATTPADLPEASLIYPGSFDLPHTSAGSASASAFSGPARRSLALRPACSLSRLCDPFAPEALVASSPPPPLRLLLAGATVARWVSHPLKTHAFSRHTEASGFSAPLSQILRRCAPQNDGWRHRRSAIHARKARGAQDPPRARCTAHKAHCAQGALRTRCIARKAHRAQDAPRTRRAAREAHKRRDARLYAFNRSDRALIPLLPSRSAGPA